MQNFTIKRVLAKTLASVSNEINAILLTQFQVKHVENKHFCQSIKKQQQEGERKKRTSMAIAKLFLLHTNTKVSHNCSILFKDKLTFIACELNNHALYYTFLHSRSK